MRIFFVSRDYSGASLARRLLLEGHEVRAHVADPESQIIMKGLIPLMESRDAGVAWAGRDGLIVVDDIGFGAWQDGLREQGYAVVGGSAVGDQLEHNRSKAMSVLESLGIDTLETRRFEGYHAAAEHVANHPRRWVVKFDGYAPKSSTFVGLSADGLDALDFLRSCIAECTADDRDHCSVVLQEAVCDPCNEIALGRYFNGHDWCGPIGFNIEHKRLFNGNLGPNTPEMGTLVWYEDEHPLFRQLLEPLTDMLRKARHVGDVDVNCLINGRAIHPLEFTTRFCYPTIQAQMALHESPWGEFLYALAHGEPYDLKWRKGFAIALLVATPPFPFALPPDARGSSFRDMAIRFTRPLSPEEEMRVHYESVSFRPELDGQLTPVICDDSGYMLHVTGHGQTVAKAREQVYELAKAVAVPSVYYRTDIGETYAENIAAQKRLKVRMKKTAQAPRPDHVPALAHTG